MPHVTQQRPGVRGGRVDEGGTVVAVVEHQALGNERVLLPLVSVAQRHEDEGGGDERVEDDHRLAEAGRREPQYSEGDYREDNQHL